MATIGTPKKRSILQLYDVIPELERIIVDLLTAIITEQLPAYCKEKYRTRFLFFMDTRVYVSYGLRLFPVVV